MLGGERFTDIVDTLFQARQHWGDMSGDHSAQDDPYGGNFALFMSNERAYSAISEQAMDQCCLCFSDRQLNDMDLGFSLAILRPFATPP